MGQLESGFYYGMIHGRDVGEGSNYYIKAEDEAGRVVTNPRKGGLEPIHIRVTNDNQPPSVSHTLITSADIGKPLLMTVKADDLSGVKLVRL